MNLLSENEKKKNQQKKLTQKLQSHVKIWRIIAITGSTRRNKSFTILMARRNLPPLVHTMEEQKNTP
jgi:hypothetical protein